VNCGDVRELVHAYVDDELDLRTARQLDQHLSECIRCRNVLEGVRTVKTAAGNPGNYYKAPPELRSRVMEAIGAGSTPPLSLAQSGGERLAQAPYQRERGKFQSNRVWWGLALAAALVLAFGLFLRLPNQRENLVVAEILTAHVRSLQPGHLMDVVSTNQHTVKPWFDTHVDFSPPVRQLAPDYPLEGGRLDYLQNRAVAVLIYKRGGHVINLFIWPGENSGSNAAERGFNFIHWTADGMTFWAVSDLARGDLEQFAHLFQSSSAPTTRK
jgi:anti-sigma factor RsiW